MRVTDFSPENQSVLNPKLWEARGQLKNEVRGALLRIAEDFRAYVGIEFPVIDTVITGSNVNYNYTSASDLDLHLITDYASLDCDRELEELFDTKRLLYEQEHDIKIFGIPVTLYVEDRSRPGVSAGLYSVAKDQWLKKPRAVPPPENPQQLEELRDQWQRVIDSAVKLDQLTIMRSVLQLLRRFRRVGLAQSQGEFHPANLVYKALRDSGELKRLIARVDQLHDQSLSLT